ncbi:hypothetical protein A6U87_10590 [Rhizobium sp. AC44/96]|uniref:glycosyltransferase family 4 protein n=1 Tax=Rhizobium sp. AC44/96 TaxID=1841654 RepID=UPI00080FCD95|nr:glycosyltransferase family 4 protein [Rhizobium sp. AC44/96]OCJ09274.1 hypothetical protein A6U87_10590 [Rhizobium sp. AC44/96]
MSSLIEDPTSPAPLKSPLRPLLIAEAANPEWASVPLVGWNFAHAILKKTNGLIATHIRNRDAILRAGLVEGQDFVAIDNEKVARAAFLMGEYLRGGSNKGWTVVTAISAFSYYSFEKEVWRQLGHRLAAGEFDLVHRITPLSPTIPSGITGRLKKHGVPFVLGPLNGGVPWPAGFGDVRNREREWLSAIRRLHRLMPGYRATRTNASAIIAGSRYTLSELPGSCAQRSFFIPENAADPTRFPFRKRELTGDTLRIAFVGRLVPYKGPDMLLDAVAAYKGERRLEIVIVGDGPLRQELEDKVRRYGLEDQVRFLGWIPNETLADALRDCHVMALPSIREFGGGVVLEAMSLGLVPVVANYGGPPELIDAGSGIAIDFSDRESLIAGLRETLERIAANPSLIAELSAGASRRVRELFTWQAKADQALAIYRWVLGQGSKPNPLEADKPIAGSPVLGAGSQYAHLGL